MRYFWTSDVLDILCVSVYTVFLRKQLPFVHHFFVFVCRIALPICIYDFFQFKMKDCGWGLHSANVMVSVCVCLMPESMHFTQKALRSCWEAQSIPVCSWDGLWSKVKQAEKAHARPNHKGSTSPLAPSVGFRSAIGGSVVEGCQQDNRVCRILRVLIKISLVHAVKRWLLLGNKGLLIDCWY